jgi:DNA-3-methyladenine glycosylase II
VRLNGALTPRAPFDLAQTLAFMRRFTPMADEQQVAGGALTKAIALNGRAVVFSVWSEGTVEQPLLAYTLTSATPLSETERAALCDRISFFLSLDDDLHSFYAQASADSALAPTVARLYGLHQPKFLTPFEIACWAILAQRMPLAMARRVKDRLVARYGPQIVVDGLTYRAFPEVAMLASADPAELAAIVRNERKLAYLGAVIELFSEVDEAWLRAGPLEEVLARLRATRGIGEWSATFILVRGLGRMAAAPSSDEELRRAAGRLYNAGKNAGEPLATADLARLLERYGEARGYWAFYCRNALISGEGSERPGARVEQNG